MRNLITFIVIILAGLLMAACAKDPATSTPLPEPEPTSTAAPSPTAEPTLEPTATALSELDEEASAQEEEAEVAEETEEPLFPAPTLLNDEGGPVSITGVVTYTNPFFTLGVAEPLVILEDQAGFVDRDRSFLMPIASQTLGQITSDFFESPFTYSLSLPIEPQGTYRDVDNDGQEDQGLQIYAVAYWNNVFGDPFLEERDLSGGGWSTAYASTLISDEAESENEIVGGKLLIFAPDDKQGFPSGFGEDGLLFTEDDPIVQAPAGYSIVNLDTEPFEFDRSRHQVVDLIEPEDTALDDYSSLPYTEAFDALLDQLRDEYAFTEYKNIDWNALREEFYPRFQQAVSSRSALAYRRALRDFSWRIPDGHVSGPQIIEDLQQNAAGGLGMSLAEFDDGRIVVEFLSEDGPAAEAGILKGAEILAINGIDIQQIIEDTIPYTGPYSTEHTERIDKIRFATRFPLNEEVVINYQNPDQPAQEAALVAVFELDSLFFESFEETLDGFEQPVEYELLEDSGFAHVKIYSFSDNDLLTIQLWERLMQELNEANIPGLIIDLRQNSGGRGFLADQMAAHFFRESLVLGNMGFWDEDRGEFYFDPQSEERFYLPDEQLIYDGEIVVIVGPSCASACEFFAHDMTLDERATIIGLYPTAGLGGSIARVKMPENEFFTFTRGRGVDESGQIHIEGIGVVPEITLPRNEETILNPNDVILESAVELLDSILYGDAVESGSISMGETVEGILEPGTSQRYQLDLQTGTILSIYLVSDEFDPVISLYDDVGNPLFSTEDFSEAAITDIEVPFDFTVFIDVIARDEIQGGSFTLSVVDAS